MAAMKSARREGLTLPDGRADALWARIDRNLVERVEANQEPRPAGPLLDALDKAGERRNHRSGEDRRFDALGADHRSREPAEQGCESDQDSEADLAGAGEVGGHAGSGERRPQGGPPIRPEKQQDAE